MNWKRIVKSCIPPIAIDLLRSYKHGTQPDHTWEGIYEHYKDVPGNGLAFESDVWADSMGQFIQSQLADKKNGINSTASLAENAFLPFLVSIISTEKTSVRILDFGGGLGATYLHLRSLSRQSCAIDYHVVETPRLCEQGGALFRNDNQIHFHSSLPVLGDVDVVYISSALQYVEDYVGLLQKLSAYQPRFILFVKLSSGDIPTYATAQKNVRGSTIPYWFLNIDKLVEIMSAAGYVLTFRSVLEREYNQDNFPEEYRLKRACNLLFSRAR